MFDEWPQLMDDIRAYPADGGQNIAVFGQTEPDGSGVAFKIDVGLMPKLIDFLFRAAAEAQKERKVATADHIDAMAIAAQRPKSIQVRSTPNGSSVGLTVHLSGVPFTASLTRDEAADIGTQLLNLARGKLPDGPRKLS